MPSRIVHLPLSWNDPAWSISCELAAYLLFPLLAIFADWRRLSVPAGVAVAAAMLLALHWIMRDQPGLGSDIPRYGLARCVCEFTAGTILAALWQRSRSALIPTIAAAALLASWSLGAPETLVVPAALAALLLALATFTASPGRVGPDVHSSPAPGGAEEAPRCMPEPARHDGRAIGWRMIHHLGEISYATYLSHFLLWKAFKLAFVQNPAAVSPALIALYLAAVLIASALLYRYVERPAQRWINALPIRRVLPPVPRRARR